MLPIALTLRGPRPIPVRRPGSSRTLLVRALDLARKFDDRWTIPHALHGLAHVAIARNDLDAAEPALIESLSVAREIGCRWSLAIGLTIHWRRASSANALPWRLPWGIPWRSLKA